MGFVDIDGTFLFGMVQLWQNWREGPSRPKIIKRQQLFVAPLAENDYTLMRMDRDFQRMIGLDDLSEEALRIGMELRKRVSFH